MTKHAEDSKLKVVTHNLTSIGLCNQNVSQINKVFLCETLLTDKQTHTHTYRQMTIQIVY